jgi:hypothetical protein
VLDRALRLGVLGTLGIWGFYAAWVMVPNGDRDRAIPLLQRFVKETSGNPREWGVTCRVELAAARAVLAKLASRDGAESKMCSAPGPACGVPLGIDTGTQIGVK